MESSQKNQCGNNDCSCANSSSDLKDQNITPTDKKNIETPSKDPTRFGDWEINGRAIDF
jgi:hypothetical protein